MPIISRVRLSVPAGSDAPSGNADSAIFRESSLITTTRRRRPTLVPTLRVGTRGKPPPDPCCGKADVKRAVVLSEERAVGIRHPGAYAPGYIMPPPPGLSEPTLTRRHWEGWERQMAESPLSEPKIEAWHVRQL